ncbi:MAG: NAD-dependent epimerase/dehydratase family protein [Zwartia sp.]
MSNPSFSVSGLHVLISGGCGGIGTAFAKAFLANGAQVTVTDMQPPAPDPLESGARYEHLDVTSDDAVTKLAEKIDQLDVLIHCAGKLILWEEHKPFNLPTNQQRKPPETRPLGIIW